ncbi:MAG: hypothetical protein ACR2I0_06760 [Rhodoferax sp.]
MSVAVIAALFCTVVLLIHTAYFIMGAIPLLILAHDTSLDSRFVRAFFNTYYQYAMPIAGATAISYAAAGQWVLAAGASGLALLAVLLRRIIISKMDTLRAGIQDGSRQAIPGFRRTHVLAIAINLVQLVLIVWSLISSSAK